MVQQTYLALLSKLFECYAALPFTDAFFRSRCLNQTMLRTLQGEAEMQQDDDVEMV